jgi:hypothetical protein
VEADVTAADQDQAACGALPVAKGRHHCIGGRRLGHHIDIVAELDPVSAVRHEGPSGPDNRNDNEAVPGHRVRQLGERRSHGRAGLGAVDAEEMDLALGQLEHVERARRAQPAGNAAGDLKLGRDNDIDRQLVISVEAAPDRLQVAMMADTGDAPPHPEQGVGDLAGHHVDLVRAGDRNKHVGAARAGPLQSLGMRGVANHAAHVVALVRPPGRVRRAIQDGDIDAFGSEVARNGGTSLAGAADDHPHGSSPSIRGIRGSQQRLG